MEALYTKLYNKYNKLKREKDTHMEKLNRNQEEKFMNYVTAADEMIEYLRSENDRLGKQVSELRSEMALIRSTKDEECVQHQRLLMEENKKNKELLEEIEGLNNLQRGLCCQFKGDNVDYGPLDKPGSSPASPNLSAHISERITRKRSRQSMNGEGSKVAPCATKEVEPVSCSGTVDGLYKQTKAGDALPNYYLPACCKRRINSSGDSATETSPASCKFQDLVEFAVGMKLSTVAQDGEFCVSVHHPSSGYSFSLTWVNSNGEPELLYRLLSLGTFERVAPEWMRNVLMFSTSMCPIFFERVSRVIKLNH